MQIARLFQIVYLLLEKKTVTAAELAIRFEVSVRTIYRDIEALCQAGIPISAAQGKGGGYALMEGFVLNKSVLTEDEQGEILLALQSLSAAPYAAAGETLKKLGSLFQKSAAGWLEVDLTSWGSDARQKEAFGLLKNAVLTGSVIDFTYFSTAGEKTRRRAEPSKLLFKDRAWYLRGYDPAKHAFRTFKLARMSDLRFTGETGTHREDGEAAEDAAEESPAAGQAELLLKIAPEGAYKVYDDFDASQITKNSDGSFTVSAAMPGGEWLYGYLLSYGTLLEVLAPAEIRDELIRRLRLMAAKYTAET